MDTTRNPEILGNDQTEGKPEGLIEGRHTQVDRKQNIPTRRKSTSSFDSVELEDEGRLPDGKREDFKFLAMLERDNGVLCARGTGWELYQLDGDEGETSMARERLENLEVLEVSPETKRRLLRSVIEEIGEEIVAGTEVIDRIKSIDPGLGEQFSLKADDISRAPLRLLCRQGQDENLIKGFVALSYCWHSDSWPIPRPLSTKEGLPLTIEMWDHVLSSLEDDQGLWIDQICINQSDDDEKRAAVGSMDVIYRSAVEVVVIVEDVVLSPNEQYELQLLEEYYRNDKLYEYPEDWENVASKIAFSRWFRRAWCLHEYFCSEVEKVNFWIPTANGRLNIFPIRAVVQAGMFGTIKNNPFLAMLAVSYTCTHTLKQKRTYPLSVHAIAMQVFGRAVSVPTDKISIILNLSGLGISWKPATSVLDWETLNYIVAVCALAGGEVDFLTSPGMWYVSNNRHPDTLRFAWTSLENDERDNKNLLSIKTVGPITGVILGKDSMELEVLVLHQWESSPPSEKTVTRVREFLASEAWREYQQQQSLGIPNTSLDESLDPDQVQVLAAGLELGLDWMRSLLEEIQLECLLPGVRPYYSSRFVNCPVGLKRKVFELLVGDEAIGGSSRRPAKGPQQSTTDEDAVAWFIQMSTSWMLTDHRRRWNLNHSRDNLVGLSDLPPKIENIVPINPRKPKPIFVVPTMMADPRFGCHNRLWVIHQTSDSSPETYSIISKHSLFGFGWIREDLNGSIVKRRITITKWPPLQRDQTGHSAEN